MNKYGDYIFIFMGVYFIFRGIMLFATGKVSRKEEERIREYSENGQKRYKIVSAVMNILGGIYIIVIYALRMLNMYKSNVDRFIIIGVLLVMIVVYIVLLDSCKKVK